MRDMANTIFLEYSGEYAIAGCPIPCLDTEVWIGEADCDGPWYTAEERAGEVIPGRPDVVQQQVMYSFYKKPMAARLTMLSRSALSNNSKVATVSAEVVRRLKRTSTAISRTKYEEILMGYMDDLAGMGYGCEWRLRVLRSAMLGYRRVFMSLCLYVFICRL